MPKKTFIFLILILISFGLLVFNLFKTKEVKASPGDNVWGWAWSNMYRDAADPAGPHYSTLGWISFNCYNEYDGVLENHCEPPYEDYGVTIDPVTGSFSGYAWAGGGEDIGGTQVQTIGWLDFAPAGPYPAGPDYSVKVDLATGEVSGWARACTVFTDPNVCSGTLDPNRGGWDGWIKLAGDGASWNGAQCVGVNDYGNTNRCNWGVKIDTNTGYFSGWAWSDMVVGWISFERVKADPDLFVPSNLPPYVDPGSAIISGERYCDVAPGVGQISFEWTYKDNDGDNQSHYHLQVATDLGFNNKVVDSEISQSIPPDEKGTSAVLIVPDPTTYSRCISGGDFEGRCVTYGNSYYWRVKVKAATGNQNWSGWETGSPSNFTTDSHAYPWIDFDWEPERPSVNHVIQFFDQSEVYGGAIKSSWDWEFQHGNPPFLNNQSPTTTFTVIEPEGNEVTLEVCDDAPAAQGGPYCCPGSQKVNVIFPLPEYKEVPPMIWLRNFLAWVTNIFARF